MKVHIADIYVLKGKKMKLKKKARRFFETPKAS